MSQCDWLIRDPYGDRSCARTGYEEFGDLQLCHQHFEAIVRSMYHAICGRRYKSVVVQRTAREALEGLDAERRAKQAEQRKARQLQNQLVYFVEREGFVKIGYTADLTKRLKDISRGSCLLDGMTVGPVRLLATIPGGDLGTESWMHRRFAHLRVGGEWFLPDDEFRQFVAGLKGCIAEDLKATA